MLLSLGNFQFSIDTAAYQQLEKTTSYSWSKIDRLQNSPTYQATAMPSVSISLNGEYYPGYRAPTDALSDLVKDADEMTPLSLTSGDGRSWGDWVITSLRENGSVFFDDGTPRKVEFSISLERFNE